MNIRLMSSAVLLSTLLAGCLSTSPMSGNTKGSRTAAVPQQKSRRAVREFYVRPGINQYLLLPQRLTGPAGHQAELDLVVRDSASVPFYALLHASLITPAESTPFTATDTLLLNTAAGPVPVIATRILYTEPYGKGRLVRLEAVLPINQLQAYLRGADFSLFTSQPDKTRRRYYFKKKAAKNVLGFATTIGVQ